MKHKPDYFESENLYLAIERVSNEVGVFKNIESENIELWESNILRKVANSLRQNNMTLEQAFSSIDTGNFGYIKATDFRQLLNSLQVNLSEKVNYFL